MYSAYRIETGKIPDIPITNDMDDAKKVKSGFLFLGALLIAATAIFIFAWLAEEMLEGDTLRFDNFVRTAVHQLATSNTTRLMQAFSFLGSVAVLAAFCLAAICVCLYFRRTRTAILLAITMLGAAVLDSTLKYAFHRFRPVAFFGLSPTSFSFPSGHALGSLCFYGMLASLLAARVRTRGARFYIWMAAVFLIAMIGLSRIYLGVHYPSDVAAGYCAATLWVGSIEFIDKTLRFRGRKSS